MAQFDPYREWLDITSPQRPPNHYELLGLANFETDEEIVEQAAMNQMSRLLRHEDGPHGDLARRLIEEVQSAQDCLSDPHERAAYDQQLREAEAARAFSDDDVNVLFDSAADDALDEDDSGFRLEDRPGTSDVVMGLSLPPRSEGPVKPPAPQSPARPAHPAPDQTGSSPRLPVPGDTSSRAATPAQAAQPERKKSPSLTKPKDSKKQRKRQPDEDDSSIQWWLSVLAGGGAVVAAIVFLVLLLGEMTSSSTDVHGRISRLKPDGQTPEPLRGVTVTLVPISGGENIVAKTQEQGYFSTGADVTPGWFQITIAAPNGAQVHPNYTDPKKTPWSVYLPQEVPIDLEVRPDGK